VSDLDWTTLISNCDTKIYSLPGETKRNETTLRFSTDEMKSYEISVIGETGNGERKTEIESKPFASKDEWATE
jgi:hypothetical protein